MKAHRSRHRYAAALGVAVGSLLTGLLLPFLIEADERVVSTAQYGRGQDERAIASGEPGAVPDRSLSQDARQPGTKPTSANAAEVRPPSTAPSLGQTRASDVGVSNDAVEVGVLIFELGSVADFGFGVPGAEPDAQQRYFQAFIDAANREGGVAGRRIEPVYRRFEPNPNGDSEQAACLALTEDAEVFLVFAAPGFVGDASLCVTEQHGTLLLGGLGESEEYYRRSRGLLFTTNMSSDRTGRNMVSRAHDQGLLDGADIGVVMDTLPESRIPTRDAVIPRLEALGYRPAHVTELPSDTSTASSQMTVAISQMRAKGVDVVFFTASAVRSNLWFNEADAQQFRPLYVVSDLNGLASNFAVQAAPSTLRAVAYSAMRLGEQPAGRPEQAEAAACRQRYEEQTGARVERSDANLGYTTMSSICALVTAFVRAGSAAGPELTRARFIEAMPRLGAWALPGIGGTVSFAGKNHGADYMRRLDYVGGCRCWHAGDEFSPVGA